jgi:hypothetical protein
MQNEPSNEQFTQPEDWHEQAERCRRLSRSVYDRATSEMLNKMAQRFDRNAAAANEA